MNTLTDTATGISYKIYSFSGGTNTVSITTNSNWYYLCIGGGGNGGDSIGRGGGGGGAGGYLEGSFNNVNGKISININVDMSTKQSIITGDIDITSYAGGRGGMTTVNSSPLIYVNGGNGGSGGGTTQTYISQPAYNSYGLGTSGQGYMGYISSNIRQGGGGGGGGIAGGIYVNSILTANVLPTNSSQGMDGKKCNLPGISLAYTNYFCAGGGGGANVTGQLRPSLLGGSNGAGGDGMYNANGSNATTYGSGGGGAGGDGKIGGSGYQGIIVIAFEI